MSSFTTKSVHHLGFVVANLDETLKAWEAMFGVKAEISENEELQVRLGAFNVAGIRFVFNESTHPDSRWAKYLNENGEGSIPVPITISISKNSSGPDGQWEPQRTPRPQRRRGEEEKREKDEKDR